MRIAVELTENSERSERIKRHMIMFLVKNYCRGCVLFFGIAMLCGCSWSGHKPQFVVLSADANGSCNALFSFDLKKTRRCCVTYVDVQGQVLSRVEGALPEDTFVRYQQKLANRKRSAEAGIVIMENGEICLGTNDLTDLKRVVSSAPPCASVRRKMHPSFGKVFRDHGRELRHD